LRRSELLTYPTGRHKTKYQCLAVGELDNLIPPGTIAAFVIGDDRARYGIVTTNADLQSSCFLGKSFWLGERLAATNLCQQGNDKSCLFCVESVVYCIFVVTKSVAVVIEEFRSEE